MTFAADSDNDGDEALSCMQADFPAFRIWREVTWGRARYVARRLQPGIRPHTVVTADPGELRAALSAGYAPGPDGPL